MAYQIVYSDQAKSDLRWLKTNQQRIVTSGIPVHLLHQPTRQTTNVLLMRPNPLNAEWELRLGNIRVYYRISQEPQPQVRVLRIGMKNRNRVELSDVIFEIGEGGEWIEL